MRAEVPAAILDYEDEPELPMTLRSHHISPGPPTLKRFYMREKQTSNLLTLLYLGFLLHTAKFTSNSSVLEAGGSPGRAKLLITILHCINSQE